MKISLNEFEHQIDAVILKRGLDYFKKGYVTGVDELGGGDYEITVEGSETYTVYLNMKGNAVTEFECDCPYDMGPVCKHVVAALFYLRNNTPSVTELPAEKNRKKQKEKSVAEQAEEILGILSHADLKAFVHNTCMDDSKFRQLFVAKHIHLLYPESKDLYVKQLHALIKTHSDKHGFIGYKDAKLLGNSVSKMTEEAIAGLAKGRIQKAMLIALAIIEEMTNLLNYNADDSNGEIDSCIEDAFTVLDEMTELDLSTTQHDELFGCLFALFEKKSLQGWDWYFDTITLCIKLIQTDQEKAIIKSALDKIKPNGQSWDWDYRRAQELMLELIKKTESDEAATRFIENNLSNSQFRAESIEKALEAKDYQKVERLTYEGIAKDEKEAPGQAEDWRNYLLIAYQQSGDTENTIRFARHFLIHSNGHYHPSAYYYKLLKPLISQEQWPNYLSGLIDDIKKKSTWIDYDRISQLYIWETCWDELFALLRQNASFERVADAEQYLAQSYSNELAALYKGLILIYLERGMSRDHYQTACRYIRRMIKLGAYPMATDLIQGLKTLYPKRRALLEELNKI